MQAILDMTIKGAFPDKYNAEKPSKLFIVQDGVGFIEQSFKRQFNFIRGAETNPVFSGALLVNVAMVFF